MGGDMRLGFLGTGTIATAVVEGIAGDGHEITVSERSAQKAAALAAAHANVTIAANQQVIDVSEVIFLGLMAEVADEILAPLQFRPGQKVISFMAGASLDRVAERVAPAEAAGLGTVTAVFLGIVTLAEVGFALWLVIRGQRPAATAMAQAAA